MRRRPKARLRPLALLLMTLLASTTVPIVLPSLFAPSSATVIICNPGGDETCPPQPGTYSVSSATLEATSGSWSGEGHVTGNSSPGSFSFVLRPPAPVHPPDPCRAAQVFTGSMAVTWWNGDQSAISLDHVIYDPNQPPQPVAPPTPIRPPSPIRGTGEVTSGDLLGQKISIAWHPPAPVCPSGGTAESGFTGSIAFGG